jgi:hypothetical protein
MLLHLQPLLVMAAGPLYAGAAAPPIVLQSNAFRLSIDPVSTKFMAVGRWVVLVESSLHSSMKANRVACNLTAWMAAWLGDLPGARGVPRAARGQPGCAAGCA